MIDKITLERIQTLHPKIRKEAETIYTTQIVPALTGKALCRFAFTLRTFAEQSALYAQGRTKFYDANGHKVGIVTNAKAGQSLHNYGLALDIVLVKGSTISWNDTIDYDKDGKADWMEVVEILKTNGWTWGGDWKSFKDKPHFEKPFGNTWRTLLAKHNAKDFIPGTNYVRI